MISRTFSNTLRLKALPSNRVVAAAFRPFSAAVSTQEVFDNFVAAKDPSVTNVLTAMKDMTNKEMNFVEFKEFKPMADELALYFKNFSTSQANFGEDMNADDFASLASFGSTFAVGDAQYWNFVTDSLSNSQLNTLPQDKTLQLLYTLQDEDKLSSTLYSKLLKQVVSSLNKGSVEQAVIALNIANSAQSQVHLTQEDIASHNAAIEKFLIDKASTINPADFQAICCNFEDKSQFAEFFDSFQSTLQEWLDSKILETSDVAQCLKIYHSNESIAEQLEYFVLQNALHLSTKSAGEIISVASPFIKETELVEICEKMIAGGLDIYSEVPNGASELLHVMAGFLATDLSRSKIILVLAERLISDAKLLSGKELCELLVLLSRVHFDDSHLLGHDVEYTSSVDGALKTLEPYVADIIGTLDFEDLKNAYIGFTHVNATSKLQIVDSIEFLLQEALDQTSISLNEATNILYDLATNETGSDVLVSSLAEFSQTKVAGTFQALKDSKFKADSLNVTQETAFQLSVIMDILKPESYERTLNQAVKIFLVLQKEEASSDYDMVYVLKNIFDSQEMDQFNRATIKELNQLFAKVQK